MDLDTMLDEISVHSPDEREESIHPDRWPEGWHAVSNESGVYAYFLEERDAFRFRLNEINRRLNG